MLTQREFVAAVIGAARLARFDRGGTAFFDTGIDAFWRSFWAAVIAAPAFALMVSARAGLPEADLPSVVIVEGLRYVISWFLWPLLMVYVARLLDREDRFFDYIIAYNWATLIQYAIFVPVTLLAFGESGAGPGAVLSFAALIYTLVYSGFVAYSVLRVPAFTAVGIVVLDVVVSIFLDTATDILLLGG